MENYGDEVLWGNVWPTPKTLWRRRTTRKKDEEGKALRFPSQLPSFQLLSHPSVYSPLDKRDDKFFSSLRLALMGRLGRSGWRARSERRSIMEFKSSVVTLS